MSVSPTSRPVDPNDPLGDIPGRAPRVRYRHALGLPAGSVCALISLTVIGMLGVIVYFDKEREPEVKTLYAYLWFMLFLIIASFFASHGANIAVPEIHEKSPLGLPRGSVRFLIIAGFAAIVAWLYHTNRLTEEPPTLPPQLLVLMPGGFFLGWLIARVVRTMSQEPQGPFWFQDLEAWVAIIAIILLVADLLLQMSINPSLPAERRISLSNLEGALAGMVSFYFGVRT